MTFQGFDWLSGHAREIATIKLCSGCSCKAKSAVFLVLFFYKTVIPLAPVGYEMITANSAQRGSLAIYHFISNARSWNNCFKNISQKQLMYCQPIKFILFLRADLITTLRNRNRKDKKFSLHF